MRRGWANEPQGTDSKGDEPGEERNEESGSQSLLSHADIVIQLTHPTANRLRIPTGPLIVRQGLERQTQVCRIENDENEI
jgi:hypothetical protein